MRAYATNAGQVCSSGTRLLVQRQVQDRFVEAVVTATGRLRPGRDVGPLITHDQWETVQRYFKIAAEEGARAEIGGSTALDPALAGGLYVQPTVYTGVTNDMRIAREEIFGPVLVVIGFDTEEEAGELANDSDYGLVGGVFTSDMSRAIRVAEAIEAGQVYINSWSTSGADAVRRLQAQRLRPREGHRGAEPLLPRQEHQHAHHRTVAPSNEGIDMSHVFDYIVIGAGTAGCVLAARLSADPSRRVLLVEAGLADDSERISTTHTWPALYKTDVDWAFETVPQARTGHVARHPRGRTVGGSGSINAMAFLRGDRRDFDAWAYQGCTGWDYESVLPYFKRSESVPTATRATGATAGPCDRPRPRACTRCRRRTWPRPSRPGIRSPPT